MLPPVHRLTNGRDYRAVIRSGRRAGSRTLVVHLGSPVTEAPSGPRIGFVVSKAVGNAVTRNRVKRRLRALARQQLDLLPGSCALVIRALPAAATATTGELAADLARCVQRVVPEVSSA